MKTVFSVNVEQRLEGAKSERGCTAGGKTGSWDQVNQDNCVIVIRTFYHQIWHAYIWVLHKKCRIRHLVVYIAIKINEESMKLFLCRRKLWLRKFFISDLCNKISAMWFTAVSNVIKLWKLRGVTATKKWFLSKHIFCFNTVCVFLSPGQLFWLWGHSGGTMWCFDWCHQEEETGTLGPCWGGTRPEDWHAERAGFTMHGFITAHHEPAAFLHRGPEREWPSLISTGL